MLICFPQTEEYESGGQFGPGVHEIVYIATDSSGNEQECRFIVNITLIRK